MNGIGEIDSAKESYGNKREFLKLAAGFVGAVAFALGGLLTESTQAEEPRNPVQGKYRTAQEVLEKMKGAKFINIQDYDKINPIDQGGWTEVNAPMKDYDRQYPARLKKYLGIEMIIVRSKELIQEMEKREQEEVEKLAEKWRNEAKEVRRGLRGVTDKDVLRPARLCLAYKALLKKYDADAITASTWHLCGHANMTGAKTNAMAPLAWMELSKENIPCCCESMTDCVVTQMIGTCITRGHAGFAGDVVNGWDFAPTGEPPKDVVILGHSGAPITPHGNDRIPYTIRDHFFKRGAPWAKKYKPGETPVGITVDWPTGETASIVKFDVYRKKVSVFTGTVLDGEALYKDFTNHCCTNKIVIKMDHPKDTYLLPFDSKGGTFRSWWGSWGCHQVAFCGDLTEAVRDFAALVGFEVVKTEKKN